MPASSKSLKRRALQEADRALANELARSLSPLAYIRSLGFPPFPWQAEVLESRHKRKIINGARQSGKSTIVAGLPAWAGKYIPRSLSIIGAATEKQAVEDMEKVKDFIARDPTYPEIVRDSDSMVELTTGSRILVVPATEKAARGYSNPDFIVLDEASRIDDGTYRSGFRPMLTDNPKCELILISTPNGREGFFYRAWDSQERWEKYEIRAPWQPHGTEWILDPYTDEAKYRAERATQAIRAYFSPRHRNLEEQLENIQEMGPRLYRQEYCCEFVEPQDQVYDYDAIRGLFTEEVKPMDFGMIDRTDDVQPLQVRR